jgi:UbiA prenyltransferase family
VVIDGRRLTLEEVGVFAAVILTICSVGNYGYSMNELFDVEEDARAGRSNVAATAGSRRMWGIVVLSGLCAELLAAAAAGARGALLTIVELGLPAIYSIPPLRIKERKWLGVAADALAAHVYPAMLALLAVSHWDFRGVSVPLVVCAAAWSAAVGVRGILSHQLHTAERDLAAGLETVVHQFGAERLEGIIVAAIVPLEVAGFGGMLVCCDVGPILGLFVVLYLFYEGFKTASKRFSVTAFRPLGQRYLPFVEESFYKAWGPLVLALDAARMDIAYLAIIPVYALFFHPHLRAEARRIRSVTIAPR